MNQNKYTQWEYKLIYDKLNTAIASVVSPLPFRPLKKKFTKNQSVEFPPLQKIIKISQFGGNDKEFYGRIFFGFLKLILNKNNLFLALIYIA